MNKNTQNPSAQSQLSASITPGRFPIEIYIGFDPQNGQMHLSGPFSNWPLFFELLDMAKENIKQAHVDMLKKQALSGLVAAPANALDDIDRIAKANGR